MKYILSALSLFIFCATAFAADIALTDGRVLTDAAIVSQSPLKVTIKHATGLSSVEKTLLPPELQAKYPANETAAREAEQKAAAARETARVLEKAEAERVARVRAQREASASARESAADKEAAREDAQYASVERDVIQRARQYFRYEYNPGNNSTANYDCSVTLSEIRPVDGWPGRWFVKGRASMKYYQSQGRSYTNQTRDFEAYYSKDGRKTNFEVTVR